jgi:hypothetical protein
MKKSLALLTIITCLSAPIFAAIGVGINLSTNHQYNLSKNIENANAHALSVSFKTKGGNSVYLRNEAGSCTGLSGGALAGGTENAFGIGVRMPLSKNLGVNLFMGKAQTRFVNNANQNDTFGAAAYDETNPIIDLGAYYEKGYGDVTVALDAGYRHHSLKNAIVTTIDGAASNTLNSKHGIRIGVRVGYGF